MRNFKKFLALVLAVLMVSACAVSVAAFDDVAATDDYAEAVELLANLGVIKGRNDGTNNFYPNDTLTREEAAVIAAKILAGAKSIEWTAATTRFADVVDAWSFAYINYVDEENVMIGNANGEFNPKGMLQIDEAIKIALAIADTKAAFNASVEQAKNPTMAWWTFYVQAANEIHLTDDIGAIRNYQAKCSRGMFAQLIYNAFNLTEKNDIAANFGYGEVTSYVGLESDGAIVVLGETKITAKLFNEALKEAGYTETAADLKALNSKVYLSWLKTESNLEIVSIKVLTDGEVVLYNDAEIKLANAYSDINGDGKVEVKDHDLDKKYLIINDVKYEVGVEDKKNTTEVLGGTATDTVGIAVTVNGDEIKYTPAVADDPETEENEAAPATGLNKLPTYFKAFLYDDDGDGDFERCDIIEYAIAYITVAAATEADKADQYTVTYFGDEEGTVVNKDAKTAAKFSGLEVVADGDTPVLVQVGVAADCTVDIIEKGEPVTGKVTAISTSGKYALIDGTKYAYENDDVIVPAETRNQTVTAFLINSKLVNMSADNFKEFDFIVDDVVVNEAGNVVITGFYADGFKKDTIELNGAFDDETDRYVAAAGHYEANAHDTDSKKYGKLVTLGGTKQADGTWKDVVVTFNEGCAYTLIKNVDGYYFVAETDNTIDTYFNIDLPNEKFSIDAKYVYIDGVAQYHNKDIVVITKVADADKYDEDADTEIDDDPYTGKNAYGVTYVLTSSFAEANNVLVSTNKISDKQEISFVYVTYTGTPKAEYKDNLAEGQSIVQILSDGYTEAGYDYFTYDAFDIFEGKKVAVKATSAKLAQGEFYVVKGTDVVDNTATAWMHDNKPIRVTTTGVVTKYEAKATTFRKDGDNWVYDVSGEEYVAFGAAQITIYETGDKGLVQFKDDNATPKTRDIATVLVDANLEDSTYTAVRVDNAFVIEGKIIIVQ